MAIPTIKLNNGIDMPQLGLGVYAPRHNNEIQQAVEWALEAGCRLIDTAAAYGNEREVAAALQSVGLPRQEVFITTKVWNDDQGYEQTLRAFDRSLERLQLDVVDLYLIHWPVEEHRRETWRAFEKIYADGRTRAIGVSNYYAPHLDELFEQATITPAVNQFEFSPYCYLPDVLTYCREKNIQPEGYAPLVRGEKKDDPRLVKLADKYGKTTFQLLVRWSLQHGVVTIPKSVKRDRIRENFDVLDFVLTDEDMALLNTFYDNTRVAPDPSDIP
ncbi:aldo/keto reductase [Spirosoma arcticum]